LQKDFFSFFERERDGSSSKHPYGKYKKLMGNLIVCFKKEKKTNETTPLPYNLRCLKRKEMVLKSQSKKVYNVNAHLLKLRCVRISITYIYIYEGFSLTLRTSTNYSKS